MADAVIWITIDSSTATFVSPAPGSASVPMGNFDPILLTMTQAPGNHHIRITLTQPTGTPGTPSYVSGGVAIAAPLGTEVDIDFQVTGAQGPTYYVCGLVLDLISGPGASRTGSVNFAKHKCEHGKLTLYDANVVVANYNFYLQIQDPVSGYIGLVDPRITTGGS
jgi:hypothetical protein